MSEANFASDLLRWFAGNRRSFSWRRPPRRPFKTLIAELLLKRTRAASVVPVYAYLTETYSNPLALSRARLADLEYALRSTGLYRVRALELKATAEIIVQHYAGIVPRDLPGLLSLSGVGRYVADAVLCFAYRDRVPVIDVNVRRILDRHFAPACGGNDGERRALLEDMLPDDAAAFNYAMLDLGALVCVAGRPRCGACPIAGTCAMHARRGRTEG